MPTTKEDVWKVIDRVVTYGIITIYSGIIIAVVVGGLIYAVVSQ